jgi:hypothetical protein
MRPAIAVKRKMGTIGYIFICDNVMTGEKNGIWKASEGFHPNAWLVPGKFAFPEMFLPVPAHREARVLIPTVPVSAR